MAENDTPDSTCPSGGPQKLRFEPVIWQREASENFPRIPATRMGKRTRSTIRARWPVDPGECTAFNPIWLTNLQPLCTPCFGTTAELSTSAIWEGPDTETESWRWTERPGQVIGSSDLPGDASFHAFLWTRETDMQDLGRSRGT